MNKFLSFFQSTVKATAKLITDLISTQLKKSKQEPLVNQQTQHSCNNLNILLQLQYELGYIFSRITPPVGLSKIVYLSDLIPDGCLNNEIIIFRWQKNFACRQYSLPALVEIKTKLNIVIRTFRQRFINQCQTLPMPDNEFLIQQFPLTFRGFLIVHIVDAPMDIRLYVKVW